MYKVLLWDIDGTILNFIETEKYSLKARFKDYGLCECSEEVINLYSEINRKYWEMLERGETEKDALYGARFEELFKTLGIEGMNARAFSDNFENGLADVTIFIPEAVETLKSLKGLYAQYAVTNGGYSVQTERLKNAGIDTLFDGIFISDAVGYDKPSINYFNYVLSHIIPCKKDEILLIGDSLTSDIQGANNAKIKCCLFNPDSKEIKTDLKIDYEIHKLSEIHKIIQG